MMFIHLFLFLFLYILTNHFLNKIRNLPPSPFPTLPVLGHLHLLKKPLPRSLANISTKHGPILLLQFGYRRVLLVSSPVIAEECLTKNDIVFASRPKLIAGKYLGYNFTSLAWAPYGDLWRNLRKISSLEILSTNRLQSLSSIRSDEVKLLLRRLSKYTERDTVDMKSMFFELTMNVMMRMIAGKRYYGENVKEVEKARKFREIVTETFKISGASTLADCLPVLAVVGGIERKIKQLHRKRDEFIQNLIEERKSEKIAGEEKRSGSLCEGDKTLIDVLLSLQQSEPEYYRDEVIRSLMLVLLSAGTDTSAGTMEWALSLLLNHPETLKKAQSEIDRVVGHGRLINESDMANLPYLHCIINETMRMYPAGPLLVPHESTEKCTVGGYSIPQGTMLLINIWATQRDPKIWEDPTEFKPERFEGLEGARDGFKFMPFGSGRRGCPGEGLALRMIGLALGSILQCFEWETTGKKMVDMTERVGLTLTKAQPLLANCSPRPFVMNLLK